MTEVNAIPAPLALPAPRKTPSRARRLIELVDEGKTLREAADILNLDKDQLHRALSDARRLGRELRPRRQPEATITSWKGYHRKPQAKVTLKKRNCLRCRKPFKSTGPGNHICRSCRSSPEWHEGNDVSFAVSSPTRS